MPSEYTDATRSGTSSAGAVVFSALPLPPFGQTPLNPEIGAELPAVESVWHPDTALALIAPYFDAAFYLASFQHDEAAARDPVAHFHRTGWQRGLDPAPWFDTRYYLEANEDVRAAGIDPFVHYLRHGRSEGRSPRRPGGVRRSLINAARPPRQRRAWPDAPPGLPTVDITRLRDLLALACLGQRGLVVAISHDRYIDKTGGIQIFIDDEEAQFTGDRFAYLHVSPVKAQLTLADEGETPLPLQLVLGGRVVGMALDIEVVAALRDLPHTVAPERLFIVHSLFGHRTSTLAAIVSAFEPRHRFFWVHDYGSLCSGYNLLRNDAVFCGGPPESSMACRVCVYGEDRPAYRHRVRGLFDAAEFDVVAPSPAALSIWLRDAAGLPHRSARVHANALLHPAGKVPARTGRVRVAFVGFPASAKGWPLFAELVQRARGTGRFEFFHFAHRDARKPLQHLKFVPTQVDRSDRLAMANALAAEDIDLVAVLSPWPETFSFVTHEALAAGADVVALASGGGIVDAAIARRRGVVLASEMDVLHFFLDGAAEAYVAARREAGRMRARLIACGTTATLDPAQLDGPDPEALATADPDLVVVAAGRMIDARLEDNRWTFDLPENAAEVRLISRHVTPARLDPESGDHRRLGVAVCALWLDDERVGIGDPRRRRGWHGAPADAVMQWTNGDAVLAVGGTRRLVVEIAPEITYQRCPFGGTG